MVKDEVKYKKSIFMAKHMRPKHPKHDYSFLMEIIKNSPKGYFWVSYDKEADVLYINFKKPSRTTDSKLTDDDIIMRYEDKKIVGYTVLHASKRNHIEF